MLLNRSHGIKRNSKRHWEYDVKTNGHNFRLSDIACALGFSQMGKINNFVEYRRKLVKKYLLNLNNYKSYFRIVNENKIKEGAWHLLLFNLNLNFKKKKSSNRIFL